MAYEDHENELNDRDSLYHDQEEIDYGRDTYFAERLDRYNQENDGLLFDQAESEMTPSQDDSSDTDPKTPTP